MAIPAPLFLRLMADDFVDDPLIDTVAGQGRHEAVPEDMVAPDHAPLAAFQGPLQMISGLVLGQREDAGPLPFLDASQPGRQRPRPVLPRVAGREAALLAAPDLLGLGELASGVAAVSEGLLPAK